MISSSLHTHIGVEVFQQSTGSHWSICRVAFFLGLLVHVCAHLGCCSNVFYHFSFSFFLSEKENSTSFLFKMSKKILDREHKRSWWRIHRVGIQMMLESFYYCLFTKAHALGFLHAWSKFLSEFSHMLGHWFYRSICRARLSDTCTAIHLPAVCSASKVTTLSISVRTIRDNV
jgi:hypothetical protein